MGAPPPGGRFLSAGGADARPMELVCWYVCVCGSVLFVVRNKVDDLSTLVRIGSDRLGTSSLH